MAKVDAKKKVSKKKQTKRIVKKIAKKVIKDVVLNNVRGINRGASIREGVLQNRMMNGIVPQNMNANPQMMAAIGKNEMVEKRNNEMATSLRAAEERQKQLTEENKKLRELKKESKQKGKLAEEASKRTEEKEDLEDKIKEAEFKIASGTKQEEIEKIKNANAEQKIIKEQLRYRDMELTKNIEANENYRRYIKLQNENKLKNMELTEKEKLVYGTPEFSKAEELLQEQMKQKYELENKEAAINELDKMNAVNRKKKIELSGYKDAESIKFKENWRQDIDDQVLLAQQTQLDLETVLYLQHLANIPIEEQEKELMNIKRENIRKTNERDYAKMKGTTLYQKAQAEESAKLLQQQYKYGALVDAGLILNKQRLEERSKLLKANREKMQLEEVDKIMKDVEAEEYDKADLRVKSLREKKKALEEAESKRYAIEAENELSKKINKIATDRIMSGAKNVELMNLLGDVNSEHNLAMQAQIGNAMAELETSEQTNNNLKQMIEINKKKNQIALQRDILYSTGGEVAIEDQNQLSFMVDNRPDLLQQKQEILAERNNIKSAISELLNGYIGIKDLYEQRYGVLSSNYVGLPTEQLKEILSELQDIANTHEFKQVEINGQYYMKHAKLI